MREILQMLGGILGVIAMIIVYVNTIKSSKKEAWLFEGLCFGSAAGISIIVIFLLISLLF